jgi:hypothetical protein
MISIEREGRYTCLPSRRERGKAIGALWYRMNISRSLDKVVVATLFVTITLQLSYIEGGEGGGGWLSRLLLYFCFRKPQETGGGCKEVQI